MLLASLYVKAGFPCPAPLLVVVKNLTQLRNQVAEGTCRKLALDKAVQDQFDNASAFDADGWAKEIEFEVETVAFSFAQIFQVAVQLYGILSLPPRPIAAWAEASSYPRLPGMSTYDSVCVSHRRKLLELLYPYRGRFRSVLALSWPLVVAGASLAGDGSVEDRNFIEESLLRIWQNPVSKCGPILCLEKLRIFWESGKTAWDDCFDEPTPCMA